MFTRSRFLSGVVARICDTQMLGNVVHHKPRAVIVSSLGACVLLLFTGIAAGQEIDVRGDRIFDTGEFETSEIRVFDSELSRSLLEIRNGARIADLDLHDSVVATMTGGAILDDFVTMDVSTLDFRAGDINELTVSQQSIALLSGGTISTLELSQDAKGILRGGRILESISIADDSILTIIGTKLEFMDGRVIGTLADGTALDTPLRIEDSARVISAWRYNRILWMKGT